MGVQDAVLGRVVARPDYGYRIAKRLEEEWSPAAVYKALVQLRGKGLIEPTDVAEESGGRPRKHYRATSQGASCHAARVAKTIRDLPGRRELLDRLEEMPAQGVAEIIDEYERQVLAQIGSESSTRPAGLVGELVAQERRLVQEARLRWISIAREAIDDGSSFA